MKRQIYIAAICSALILSACSEPAVSKTTFSETITKAADEVTVKSEMTTAETTVETTAQTTEMTSIIEESTSAVTELVSETTVDLIRDRCFKIYELEVKDGAPEICDLAAIKARRRTDMAEHYTTWQDSNNVNDWNFDEYSDPSNFIEKYFGYSFDNSAPVTTYIEDDFDLDGIQEYYL